MSYPNPTPNPTPNPYPSPNLSPGLLAKRVSQTRRPESQRADSGDVGDIVAQVNEVHLSESNHDRVQELLEASAGWEFNSLDLVGPTNNHALLFLGYWIFVQAGSG